MYRLLDNAMSFMMMLVVIIGAQDWLTFPIVPSFIVYGVEYAILITLLGCLLAERRKVPTILWIYLILVVIGIVRGFINAAGYGDYRTLAIHTLAYLTPLFVHYASVPERFQRMSRMALISIPIWLFVTYPLIRYDYISRLMAIVPFFIIFVSHYRLLDKFYLLALLLLFFLVMSESSRAAFVRFSAATIFAVYIRFFPKLCNRMIMGLLSIAMFIVPVLIFILAVFYDVNLLQEQEQKYEGQYIVEIDNDRVQYKDMAGDTRTFIYEEAARSALINNYIWMGHSLSRGYESVSFGDEDVISKARGERASSEVHVVNVFTHLGVIGVIAYALLMLFGAMKAIIKARSPEVRIVGLWVAFRWMLSWFEELTAFDMGQIYLWAAVAICYSPYFIEMNSDDFKEFIRGCFYKLKWGEGSNYRTIGEE